MSVTDEPITTTEPYLTAEEIMDRFQFESLKVAMGARPNAEFYRTAVTIGVAELTALKGKVDEHELDVPKLLAALTNSTDVPAEYAELSRTLTQIGAVYLATDSILEHMVADGYNLDSSLLSALFA